MTITVEKGAFCVERATKDPDGYHNDLWDINVADGTAVALFEAPAIGLHVNTTQALDLYRALKHALQLSGALPEVWP